MALVFRELHRAPSPELLNEEWMIVENTGSGPLTSNGWSLEVARGKGRPRSLGTLSPGFILQPGEKMRLVTGTASKKAQGAAPSDDVKNYHLFLREPVLAPGVTLYLKLKQLEVARATFNPDAKAGLGT